jgi:hypothetical protein
VGVGIHSCGGISRVAEPEDMAKFVGGDFRDVGGVFIEATPGPSVGKGQISLEDPVIGLSAHDSGNAAAPVIAPNGENTTAASGRINLPKRIAERNSIDPIK